MGQIDVLSLTFGQIVLLLTFGQIVALSLTFGQTVALSLTFGIGYISTHLHFNWHLLQIDLAQLVLEEAHFCLQGNILTLTPGLICS